MRQPIVYVDVSAIREGKLAPLEAAMAHLAEFVKANMPRLISYGFYLNEDRTQMTVVAVHPDSASLVHHLDTGAGEFQKFGELIDLARIEVYGHISDDVLAWLEQKAQTLGSGVVTVHDFYAGFVR